MRLVGRESDVQVVARVLETARTRPCGLVLEGPPGIGKTELWREAQRRAGSAGFQVLTARPVEVEASLSFAALADLLEDALDSVLPSLAAPQRHALEVAFLRRDDGSPVDPRAVGMGVFNVLRALASHSPVLLAIDDVQWLDGPSVRVLEYALRRLRSEPVMTLATRREDPVDIDVPLLRALSEDARSRLLLKPLSLGAIHKILDERVSHDLHRYAVLRIYEASGGNPMLALEIARPLEEQRIRPTPGEPLPVPVGMQELLQRRLSAIDPETMHVLVIAASLAAPSVAALRRAAPKTAMAAIDRASRAGLVEVARGRVEFTHPLLRFVVAERIRGEQRRRLHARLAKVAQQPEERARHLALSVAAEDERVAAELESAALQAIARGAAVAGGELLEQAASLTPKTRPLDVARRRLGATNAYWLAGDGRRCRTLLEGLLGSLPPGRLRAEALGRLGLVRCFADDVAQGVDLLEQSVAEAKDEPRLRVGALLALALAKATILRIADSRQHVEDALAIAQLDGDRTGETEALSLLCFWRFITGDEPFAELLEQAQARARTDASVRLTFGPDFWRAQILRCTDDLGLAAGLIGVVRQLAEERGDEESLLAIDNLVAEIGLATGAWDGALRSASESAEIAERYGYVAYSVLGYAMRALIEAHLGLEEEALASVARGQEAADTTGFLSAILYLRWTPGFLELSRGHPGGADQYLGDIAAMTAAYGIVEPGAVPWLLDEVEALIALGRLGDAEALLDPYLAAAEQRERRWCRAASLRCRALLGAARGDLQQALSDAREGVALAKEGQRPFELARCLLVEGVLERRSNHRLEATRTLARAVELFRSLGARLWADRADEELRRAKGWRHAGQGLTTTESRVAALAAEGQNNPQIAAALFMSRKTVEANLSTIYRKLGIQTRAQLARALDVTSQSEGVPTRARELAPKK